MVNNVLVILRFTGDYEFQAQTKKKTQLSFETIRFLGPEHIFGALNSFDRWPYVNMVNISHFTGICLMRINRLNVIDAVIVRDEFIRSEIKKNMRKQMSILVFGHLLN